MKQLKQYLVIVICFLSASGTLLTGQALGHSNPGFNRPENIPAANKTAVDNSASNPADSPALTEEFSFLIKDFRMTHQSQNNNLNITIRYRYAADISKADYPDFRLLATDIEKFLTNYPNEDDYWEILNKKITAMLLERFPSVAAVTSEIQVSPSDAVPYLRSSIVTRNRPAVSAAKKKITPRGNKIRND